MDATENSGFLVKICGITNEADALAAVETGATALGFNFYPKSPRFITVALARKIAGILPPGVLRVAVFVNEAPRVVADVIQETGLDVAQLHGHQSVLPDSAIRVWRAVAVDSRFDSHALEENQVEAYLLDTPSIGFGGSGIPFDWKLVAGFQQRIILAGGLSGENVAAAIAAVRPWGVDACSRLESSPGKKDPQKMRDFVSAALAAQHALKTVDPSHQEISL